VGGGQHGCACSEMPCPPAQGEGDALDSSGGVAGGHGGADSASRTFQFVEMICICAGVGGTPAVQGDDRDVQTLMRPNRTPPHR
jgi:hypothetical protein